jgi:hypothetical protein
MDDQELKTNTDAGEVNFSNDYEEALANTPPEVRAFMWSQAFSFILKAIGDNFKLNDKQRDEVRRVAMETLVGTIAPVARQIRLSDVGVTGEIQDGVLEAINEEIVSRSLAQIEKVTEDIEYEKELKKQEEQDSAPSPSQALANIQERLSKPSTIAPITRDYSVSRPSEPVTKTESPARAPSMDIYREIPEN